MSTKPYLLQMDLESKPCLVVGAGPIALHKTRHLLNSGARVTVVSTSFHIGFDDLALETRHTRAFEDADIEGMMLVQAATQHGELNARIATLCTAQGILCSVAHDTTLGTFATPAVLDAGALRVAVSTQSLSPSYSARLRREIAQQLPDYLNEYLTFLGEHRAQSKQAITDPQLRMRFNAYLASAEFEAIFVDLEKEALTKKVQALMAHPETIPESYTPQWG